MSRVLKPKDEEAKRQLDPEIRSVLEAAGDTGSHIAFLDWALKASKYRQRRKLMRDVKFGFGVVGIVNVEESARSRLYSVDRLSPRNSRLARRNGRRHVAYMHKWREAMSRPSTKRHGRILHSSCPKENLYV